MFNPALNVQRQRILRTQAVGLHRRGAIMPLFAFLLPVLLILCGFAINLAYMQQVSTELKVATDAAAHAGGRAMSLAQTTDAAIAQAELTAQTNLVGGKVLSVSADGDGSTDDIEIIFGRSIRGNNGYGMYEFTEVPKAQVDDGSQRATSVGVIGQIQLPMVFNVMNQEFFGGTLSDFRAARRSIATQVDRDIALVLDRSGSMLWFKDETLLTNTLYTLYNTYDTVTEPGHWKYAYWKWRNGSWRWKGYFKPEDARSSWTIRNSNDKIWQDASTSSQRRISSSEYNDATDYLYDREYSDNVIYQLERYINPSHTLGDTFSNSESGQLTTDMAQYTRDWEYKNNGAARHSRWYFLDMGVTAFLDILEFTDQEELVSLVTFASSSTLEYQLQQNYNNIRNKVSGITPYGGTAVGDGMLEGLPPIISGPAARPFAAKTIVVLTDGDSNAGTDPEQAVEDIIGENNVTIHTVTFTQGANQDAMIAVAEAGFGRHYHADDGDALIDIFEEIANNLPTILTE